jgi:hypothetical protein
MPPPAFRLGAISASHPKSGEHRATNPERRLAFGSFLKMRRASICLASTLLATAITSGCSTATKNSDSSAPPPTAQSAAEAIKAAIPEITALVPVTESNDANNMIGRSNG